MKHYLTLFILLITCACFGQIGGIKHVTIKPFSSHSRNYINVLTLGSNENIELVYLNADTGTKKISDLMVYPNRPKTYFTYLEGATKINLEADINKDSLKNYRYSIIVDDSVVLAKELIPIQIAKGKSSFNTSFGSYKIADRKLSFTIYKVGDKENGRETIIYNKKPSPVSIISAELIKHFDVNESPVTSKEVTHDQQTTTTTVVTGRGEGVNMDIQGRQVPMDAGRSYAEISVGPVDYIFMYQILIKRQEGDEVEETLLDNLNWVSDTYGNFTTRIDINHFAKPGKYEIAIFPRIGKVDANKLENATKINFEMRKPAPTLKELGIYVGIGLLLLLMVFIAVIYSIRKKNKKKLEAERQEKERTKAQLDSVRMQLNPHFLFNALAGIQNLMNQHKTDEANRYLGQFARLTRNVLDNKELISLAEEKALLVDYLQMEQLRFGFAYQIEIDQALEMENIEIPSMLLQPFVENAVKHGVADKEEAGKIEISFKRQNNDLVLMVKDNGEGFDINKKYEGLGLQLSKDRIALLNSIYKQTPFVLTADVSGKETKIILTLTQWL